MNRISLIYGLDEIEIDIYLILILKMMKILMMTMS